VTIFIKVAPLLAAAIALLCATPQCPAEQAGSGSTDTVLVQRVDDLVTREDLRGGLVLADREAPRVAFSHETHTRAGVSCDKCHHLGVEAEKTPSCAMCHKGAAAVDTMHSACITCHSGGEAGPTACADCHTARQKGLAGIVRFELYDVIRGPLFIAAWVVFAFGFALRIVQFVRLTAQAKGKAAAPAALPTAADREFLLRGRSAAGRALFVVRRRIRGTLFGTNPVMGVVSLLFHLALFLAPLLLPAHNILFDETFRVGLPSLPEPFIDKVTVGLMAIGGFFLLRRILVPRVRALSTVRDYLLLLLVAAPFVTAYMAYHQYLDYRTVLVTHMLIGEVVIAAIPFTKLGHMPFIIFSRFFMASEYGWRPANRRWGKTA